MTTTELRAKLESQYPAFIHRIQVVRLLGIDYGAVDSLRFPLEGNGTEVPKNMIGARRGLSRARGRVGRGYWLYRTTDVARMIYPDDHRLEAIGHTRHRQNDGRV